MVVSLVILIVLYYLFKKKESEKLIQSAVVTERPTVAVILEPAYAAIETEGNLFYSLLYDIIWSFASTEFRLSGSEMNKQTLTAKMTEAKVAAAVSEPLLELLQDCEAAMFTNANMGYDRNQMLAAATRVLTAIRSAHSEYL